MNRRKFLAGLVAAPVTGYSVTKLLSAESLRKDQNYVVRDSDAGWIELTHDGTNFTIFCTESREELQEAASRALVARTDNLIMRRMT